MKLNIKCAKCNNGDLYLPEGYNELSDHYSIHCTNCSYTFETHYTGMDNILAEYEFNNQINRDVKSIN